MGTNYYLRGKPPCPHCGRPYPDKHIGKSSGGWCFALHIIPEEGINDLHDWINLWIKPEAIITDEYDTVISPMEMAKIIAERRWHGVRGWTQREYDDNHAERGPNGLIRSKIEPGHCVKHGAGTWDCIEGEFS